MTTLARNPHRSRPGGRLVDTLGSVIVLCLTFQTSSVAGQASTAEILTQRTAVFESGLRPALLPTGEEPQTWTLESRMAHYGVAAVSLAIIENGEVVVAKAYGYADVASATAATPETAFSVGSVSKMGTAAGVLRLVADEALALDSNVNRYLASWRIPDNPYTAAAPVTMRGILSHTAGLSVHGFPDFMPDETLPTLIQTLDGEPPAKHEPVRVFFEPGSAARYSGGGTTVAQLVIQDTADKPFAEAMVDLVFEPLAMSRSSYVNPIPASHEPIARAYDEGGEPDALPRGWHSFPESAASGLWTTPSDLARLYLALLESYHGTGDGFLPQALVRDMMSEVGPSYFGLGPQLAGAGIDRRFYHGGSNNAYKAHSEIHLERKSGLIIFTNGAQGATLYAEIRRAVADAFGWPYYRPTVVPDMENSAAYRESLDGRAGDYRLAEPLSWDARRLFVVRPLMLSRVLRDADTLYLTFPGFDDRRYRLVPLTPTRFVVDEYYGAALELLRVEFVSTGAQETPALMFFQNGYSATAMRTAERIDPGPAPERH